MAHSIEGKDLFEDDCDRKVFLAILKRVKEQTRIAIYSYCLMPNHFHLALKVAETMLDVVMGRLMGGYAKYLNARHHRRGHVFHGRHKEVPVRSDRQLIGLVRYIHNNPVRWGLAKLPKEWQWSSYREYQKRESQLVELVETVTDSDESPAGFDAWEKPTMDSAPSLLRSEVRPPFDYSALLEDIAARRGLTATEIGSGSRRRDLVAARRELIQEAVRRAMRVTELAQRLGLTPQAVSWTLKTCET
mgnify:CR=1 FL=1